MQTNFFKVFESILLDQITEFLKGTGFFFSGQFGSRRGLNAELAVLDLVEGIRRDVDRGRVVLIAFKDYTVGFNCLFCSSIVLGFLDAGFSASAARVIACSLYGREFMVTSAHRSSSWRRLDRRVGQGGRLGTILYIITAKEYPRLLHRAADATFLPMILL